MRTLVIAAVGGSIALVLTGCAMRTELAPTTHVRKVDADECTRQAEAASSSPSRDKERALTATTAYIAGGFIGMAVMSAAADSDVEEKVRNDCLLQKGYTLVPAKK